MNRDRVEGVCKQLIGRFRVRLGVLMSDQESIAIGKLDQLAGKAQEQYGLTQEESERQLEDFRDRNRDWMSLG